MYDNSFHSNLMQNTSYSNSDVEVVSYQDPRLLATSYMMYKIGKFVMSAEPEWPSGFQRRACCVRHGRSWLRTPALASTNARGHICKYMDRKGLAAMLTSIQ